MIAVMASSTSRATSRSSPVPKKSISLLGRIVESDRARRAVSVVLAALLVVSVALLWI